MNQDPDPRDEFETAIRKKASRKLKAQQEKYKGIWYGLGMSGLVGWSVAIPTVLGVAIGVWLDNNLSSRYSWTLMCLLLGVTLGCLNAWYWIEKERQKK
jgi:ATP synthase protein I